MRPLCDLNWIRRCCGGSVWLLNKFISFCPWNNSICFSWRFTSGICPNFGFEIKHSICLDVSHRFGEGICRETRVALWGNVVPSTVHFQAFLSHESFFCLQNIRKYPRAPDKAEVLRFGKGKLEEISIEIWSTLLECDSLVMFATHTRALYNVICLIGKTKWKCWANIANDKFCLFINQWMGIPFSIRTKYKMMGIRSHVLTFSF